VTPKPIITDRLRLRPFQPDDLDALHAFFTQREVRRYLLDDELVSRQWVAEEISGSIASFKRYGYGQWAVFLDQAVPLIGFCGYRFFHQPVELQLLYGIEPGHWGRGLATEAARAMVRFGFEQLDFKSVVASTDAPNTASVRVMEKAGLSFEKRLVIDGLDTIYYSLSRPEFERNVSDA